MDHPAVREGNRRSVLVVCNPLIDNVRVFDPFLFVRFWIANLGGQKSCAQKGAKSRKKAQDGARRGWPDSRPKRKNIFFRSELVGLGRNGGTKVGTVKCRGSGEGERVGIESEG